MDQNFDEEKLRNLRKTCKARSTYMDYNRKLHLTTCGSMSFNLAKENIDQGDLCDVHYWKNKYEALKLELLANESDI